MFTKEDLAKYRAMKAIISKSKAEVQLEAAVNVALVLNWFNALEKVITDDLLQKDSEIVAKKKVK
jgi:hypothetical protein